MRRHCFNSYATYKKEGGRNPTATRLPIKARQNTISAGSRLLSTTLPAFNKPDNPLPHFIGSVSGFSCDLYLRRTDFRFQRCVHRSPDEGAFFLTVEMFEEHRHR